MCFLTKILKCTLLSLLCLNVADGGRGVRVVGWWVQIAKFGEKAPQVHLIIIREWLKHSLPLPLPPFQVILIIPPWYILFDLTTLQLKQKRVTPLMKVLWVKKHFFANIRFKYLLNVDVRVLGRRHIFPKNFADYNFFNGYEFLYLLNN